MRPAMDTRSGHSLLYLLFLFFAPDIHGQSVTLTSSAGNKVCTTELKQCKVKMGGELLTGPPGPQGPQGPQGKQGEAGEPGYNGADGPKGDTGAPGERGKTGLPGLPGIPGKQGIPGERGEPGFPGIIGLKGDMGLPGIPGSPGVCSCSPPEEYEDCPSRDGTTPGIDCPADRLCKYNSKDISGNFVLAPSKLSKQFTVSCNASTKETCLLITPLTPEDVEKKAINYKDETEPFWLSKLGTEHFNWVEFYGLEMEELDWLQKNSLSATQVVRYHCFNSYVSNNNTEKSLHALSWNDRLVGPEPKPSFPMSYSIVPGEHGCFDSGIKEDKWKHTDLVFVSDKRGRLPVTDFHIRDTRGEEQKFYIELKKLCFG